MTALENVNLPNEIYSGKLTANKKGNELLKSVMELRK